jgi:hypothetical protein
MRARRSASRSPRPKSGPGDRRDALIKVCAKLFEEISVLSYGGFELSKSKDPRTESMYLTNE